jgi:hypothetical protein
MLENVSADAQQAVSQKGITSMELVILCQQVGRPEYKRHNTKMDLNDIMCRQDSVSS